MCDTICAVADSVVWFGKNSDREPGESQSVEVVPARRGTSGSVRCTHVAIPDVERTRSVILSRPVWMWGAEMGANDAGVVAGNEAVFTRIPVAVDGLTGMDLLRLALERASSAREAVDVVTDLLARHPQGGRMGFRNRAFRYSSSFLFADPREAWVLETAGPFWAAERVVGTRTISNVLSISRTAHVHPGAADEARRRGWLRRGEELDFARCFADPFYRPLTGGVARSACTRKSLGSAPAVDRDRMLATLRDHGGRHPADGLRLETPCAHASWAPTRRAGQTTGSMVSELRASGSRHLFTGTSSPCLSIFKPVSFDVATADLGPPTPVQADVESLFFRHERLHRSVLEDYERRRAAFEPARLALETNALDADDPRSIREAWRAHREAIPGFVKDAEGESPRARNLAFRAYWRLQSRRDAIA